MYGFLSYCQPFIECVNWHLDAGEPVKAFFENGSWTVLATTALDSMNNLQKPDRAIYIRLILPVMNDRVPGI